MDRPYFATRIDDLESLAEASAAEPTTLRGLLSELAHRETARAVKLRTHVVHRLARLEGGSAAADALDRALSPPPVLDLQQRQPAQADNSGPASAKPRAVALDALSIRLSTLAVSARCEGFFRNEDLTFVGQLAAWTMGEVMRAPNVGRKTAVELQAALANLGLDLGAELGDWSPMLATATEASRVTALAKPTQLEAATLDGAFRELVAATNVSERNARWTMMKMGWDGGPGRTLEEVGEADHVTRERVRQVVAKSTRAMRKRFDPPPPLSSALELAARLAPITEVDLNRRLSDRSLATSNISLAGLRSGAEIFQLPFPFVLRALGGAPHLLPEALASAPERLRQRAGKLVSTRGCVVVDTLVDDVEALMDGDRAAAFALAVIESDPSFASLDPAKAWWWRPERARTGRNRLVNNIRKVLAAAGSISIGELRNAVRRSYRADFFAPPSPVLATLCAALDGVSVEGGRVIASPAFDWQAELSPSEQVMIDLLRREGSVLSRNKLLRLAEDAGVAQDSLNVATTYSVVLWRPAPGVYALVGASLQPGVVEEIQAEPEAPGGRMLDASWSADGEILLSYRLSESQVRTGVVTAPAAFHELLVPAYKITTGTGQVFEPVSARGTGLAGLRGLLRAAGAEEGDALLLSLDPRSRRGRAWVGGPDMALSLAQPNGAAELIGAARTADPDGDEPD